MKTLQALIWVSASVAVVGLLGCSYRATVSVAQPQPEYVVVREAPPPIIREHRPPPPSRRYIWIDGNWQWSGKGYVWHAGRWAVPPHRRAAWVPPRYEKHERGYRYIPGRWSERHPGR